MVGVDASYSEVRVSKVRWLQDQDPFVLRLTKKVELITGLRASGSTAPQIHEEWPFITSEQFQVRRYLRAEPG